MAEGDRADDRVRRRVVVRGRVQGVGFRVNCAHEAERAGVAGTVRNLPDGGVEAAFEGPTAAVERMVEWCARGPRHAVVRDVRVSEVPLTGRSGFAIC